jgi:hypothetical protein
MRNEKLKGAKEKLKRRGIDNYNKYFFNNYESIHYIVDCLDNNIEININKCDTIFNISEFNMIKIYELISYYPKKLKEIKIITDNVINELYSIYGTTIDIMNCKKNNTNVRGKLFNSANVRIKELKRETNITSEDIILVNKCPYLDIELCYTNTIASYNSPSLDRIDNSKGYLKDNIQVISFLANTMKASASKEQLLKFSKNVIKMYDK